MVRHYMTIDMAKRRDYQRHLLKSNGTDELPSILADYAFVYAIAIVAHDPEFTSHTDAEQLLRIRRRISFVLQPLMNEDNDNFSSAFYKTLIDRIKIHCDALDPNEDASNAKLWAVCDVTDCLVGRRRSSTSPVRDYPLQPAIPSRYFRSISNVTLTGSASKS